MRRALVRRVLDSRAAVPISCGISLALGLAFVFVRAPHPWGQEGFDHYHELALTLAAGRQFPTMDVPWGYAYFLSAFYRLFGDRPWIPLTAQVVLNASMPLLVFACARRWLDRRTATLAAIVTGCVSFNTVYASTQSSDAVCNVIFMVAVVIVSMTIDRPGWIWCAIVGVLLGLAPQFRPNLILVPFVVAGYLLVRGGPSRIARAVAIVVAAALALAPWTIRNYRLTRQIVPASLHSGVQLWYGTLQTGQYLQSRAYNPRAVFEGAVFRYTSLDDVSLIVTAPAPVCDDLLPSRLSLIYWTDRDATRRRVSGRIAEGTVTFEIPSPASPAVVYLYAEAEWPRDPEHPVTQPGPGADAPVVLFVNHEHLGDLDLHGDLLDIFDVIRMMRHVAWGEPLRFADRLAAAGIGDRDLDGAVVAILKPWVPVDSPDVRVARFVADDRRARLELGDGSSIVVPRIWRERITDVDIVGTAAATLMSSTAPMRSVSTPRDGSAPCERPGELGVNTVFYRQEPHLMRRYFALAWDNIERAPAAFAAASLYRAVRLFVIRGSDDSATAHQFSHSGVIYLAAEAASLMYAVLFCAGVFITWRQGRSIALPLLLVLYVPATIAPMLTNMRYTVTMQPLVFIFVAAALTAVCDWTGRRGSAERA